jgi:hypothetical protein
MRKVIHLQLDTTLLPGQGHASTLRDELETNPYVQAAVEAER